MKSWKFVSGAVLVLAGFCAGMVLNVLPFGTIVHGASEKSDPALKSVAHNATLAGDGTTTAPLGIANGGVGTPQVASGAIGAAQLANGAVTAPKIAAGSPAPGQVLGFNGAALAWQTPATSLNSVAHDTTLSGDGSAVSPLGVANGGVNASKLSTSATPSPGQVLGFNGNLAWQNAPVGGVRVVDSRGHVVGPFAQVSAVLRQIGAYTFLLGIDADGFQNSDILFAYTTPDCTGTRYVYVDGNLPYRQSQNTNTQLVYPADPLQQTALKSFQRFNLPTNPNQLGPCQTSSVITLLAGVATTVDLSTLNLTPPFHLEF